MHDGIVQAPKNRLPLVLVSEAIADADIADDRVEPDLGLRLNIKCSDRCHGVRAQLRRGIERQIRYRHTGEPVLSEVVVETGIKHGLPRTIRGY